MGVFDERREEPLIGQLDEPTTTTMHFLPFRLDRPERPLGEHLHELVRTNTFEHPKDLQDRLVNAAEALGHNVLVSLRSGTVYVNDSVGPLLRVTSPC